MIEWRLFKDRKAEALARELEKKEIIAKSKIKYIDKSEIDAKIMRFVGSGVTGKTEHPQIIVSLTSFPERMFDIHYCLFSLLDQRVKPDMVVLWLAEKQFPHKEKDLPASVLSLLEHGLTIKWCDDLRSYKKLVPALHEFPSDIIVTADDDIYFPETWLGSLYDSYRNAPELIHAHRAHRLSFGPDGMPTRYDAWQKEIATQDASFSNFMTSGAGTLYPPHSLYVDVTNQKLFKKLCPTADDVWFWAMALLKGTKIRVVENNIPKLTYVNPERELRLNNETTLMRINVDKDNNDRQIKNVLRYYPALLDRLHAGLLPGGTKKA
jgi:hypothetical protein